MLELKNITKTFKTDSFVQNALDDLTLRINEGELTAILGESGSGKSTLLNILGGLDHATSGSVIIDGIDTKKYSKNEWAVYRNHYVGFIFQEYNLIDHMRIIENVELPLLLQGEKRSVAREKAKAVLKELGLEKQMKSFPNQISGGQQQRAAIARALVTDPKIIMADEPTGALDTVMSDKIVRYLKKIAQDRKIMVIMVTHDTELADNYADRIITLSDGKVINDTNSKAISSDSETTISLKKPKMSIGMTLRFAKSNLSSRIFRTVFTVATVSIGIIGVFLLTFILKGLQSSALDIVNDIAPSNIYTATIYSDATDKTFTDEYASIIEDSSIVNEVLINSKIPYGYLTINFGNIEEAIDYQALPENKQNFVKYKSIYGKYPEKENEVILSSETVKSILNLNEISKTDYEYILNLLNKYSPNMVASDYDQTIDDYTTIVNKNIKIVGFILDNTYGCYARKSDAVSLINVINNHLGEERESEKIYAYDATVFFNEGDVDKIDSYTKKLFADHRITCVNSYYNLTKPIESFFDSALRVLVSTVSLSLIVSGILIGLIIYTSVVERTKEIGILTALGARKNNIRAIFILESSFIGFISAMVGFIISSLLSILLNLLFKQTVNNLIGNDAMLGQIDLNDIAIARIDALTVIVLFIASIIFSSLIGLFPANKAAKVDAIKSLRNE